MDKNITMPSGAGLDLFLDQAAAGSLEARHGGGQIGNAHRHVVQALAAPVDEASHCRLRRRRLKEFDGPLTERQHGHPHLLVRYLFPALDGKTEERIEPTGGIEIAHGDAEMIKGRRHGDTGYQFSVVSCRASAAAMSVSTAA